MRIGFGCVTLGSASDGRGARSEVRLVHEAIDHGVRVFDTADVYGRGASERVLGAALIERRDEVVIATKAGYVFRPRSTARQAVRRRVAPAVRYARARRTRAGGQEHVSVEGAYSAQDFSPAALRRAIDASLRRLRTDRIDVFQLHGPPPAAIPETIAALDDLVTDGKVVRFGVGAESVDAADAWLACPGVEVVQLPFGVLDPEAAVSTLPAARQHGVELWARGALGGGLIADAGRDLDSLRHHPKCRALARLAGIADTTGLPLDHLAIGFVRAFAPAISTLVLGISSSEHLRRDLRLFEAPPLGRDVLALLAHVRADDDVGSGGSEDG